MFTNTTKKYLKLIPVTTLILSVMLTGNVIAEETSDTQTLINWNEEVQATLSSKMEQNLEMEMQALANSQPEESQLANQLPDMNDRDLVLIGRNENGTGVSARSTTPVIVIIDRKELCLLNI